MPADGLPVIIQELGPPFRSIVFAGRDRPEQPVEVAGRQRATQTWYPGTTKASTQVMGTEEDPIPLRGWFQDPLTLLDGGPGARMAILRDLMQGQNLCQLLWGTVIIRQGRVSRCSFQIHREAKIRYEVVFAVDQPNEARSLAPKVGAASVVSDLAQHIAKAVALADKATAAVRTTKTIAGVVL